MSGGSESTFSWMLSTFSEGLSMVATAAAEWRSSSDLRSHPWDYIVFYCQHGINRSSNLRLLFMGTTLLEILKVTTYAVANTRFRKITTKHDKIGGIMSFGIFCTLNLKICYYSTSISNYIYIIERHLYAQI